MTNIESCSFRQINFLLRLLILRHSHIFLKIVNVLKLKKNLNILIFLEILSLTLYTLANTITQVI